MHRGLTLLILLAVSGVITMLSVRGMAWYIGSDILKYYPIDLLVESPASLLPCYLFTSSPVGI